MFDLDLEHCLNCGGELKIIASTLEQPVIEKILTLIKPATAQTRFAPVL